MKKLLISLLLCTLCTASLFAQSETARYIKKYRAMADSFAHEYSIPASVILGVAIVESSSGTGRTVRLLNNHFGMTGRNNLKKTHKIKTMYKQYPSAASSYRDFCLLVIKRKFYPRLQKNKDYKAWLTAISKTGYSARPAEWVKRISGVIIKNKL